MADPVSLRNLFPHHYDLDIDAAKEVWANAFFVFDANVLLNLYAYRKAVREDIFSLLEVLKEDLWMPYQIAMEFQRNRRGKIQQTRSQRQDHLNELKGLPSAFLDLLPEKDRRKDYRAVDRDKFATDLEALLAGQLVAAQEQLDALPQVRGDDAIRERIDGLFTGRIGARPADQATVKALEAEGQERYAVSMPPGFGDSKEKKGVFEHCDDLAYQTMYGDYLMWKEVLSKAAMHGSTINCVLVTDESAKGDWWERVGDRLIGPLQALAREYFTLSKGGRLILYDPATFLQAAETLKIGDFPASAIEEVSTVTREEVALQRSSASRMMESVVEKVARGHYESKYGYLELRRFPDLVSVGHRLGIELRVVTEYNLHRLGRDIATNLARLSAQLRGGEFDKVIFSIILPNREVAELALAAAEKHEAALEPGISIEIIIAEEDRFRHYVTVSHDDD